jgi:hypothetical protein
MLNCITLSSFFKKGRKYKKFLPKRRAEMGVAGNACTLSMLQTFVRLVNAMKVKLFSLLYFKTTKLN